MMVLMGIRTHRFTHRAGNTHNGTSKLLAFTVKSHVKALPL